MMRERWIWKGVALNGLHLAGSPGVQAAPRLADWEVAKHAREIDLEFPIIRMTGDNADEWGSECVPRLNTAEGGCDDQ